MPQGGPPKPVGASEPFRHLYVPAGVKNVPGSGRFFGDKPPGLVTEGRQSLCQGVFPS